MSSEWLDKAKAVAASAAEEAKKLAETAKNANYGEMLDKTKSMAMQAADEAKKAANSVMSKDKTGAASVDDTAGDSGLEEVVDKSKLLETCNARLAKIETILQEVKNLLNKP